MKELQVITYNIHDGRETTTLLQNFQNFFDHGVDLICLQEVRLAYHGIDMPKLIRETLGEAVEAQYFLDTKKEWFDFGLGFLWKRDTLKPLSFHYLTLPLPPQAKLWERVFLKYLHAGIVSMPIYRGAFVATFKWNQRTLRITNTHLDWQGGDAHRTRQIEIITNYLNTQPPVDCEIICGDFNTLGLFKRKRKIEAIKNSLPDGFQNIFTEPYATLPPQQLDYVFTKGFIETSGAILKIHGSDHFPISAVLKAA